MSSRLVRKVESGADKWMKRGTVFLVFKWEGCKARKLGWLYGTVIRIGEGAPHLLTYCTKKTVG